MVELLALYQRNRLTELLEAHPYDAALWLHRACAYEDLGFPDLAAADGYKALLLTDEAKDESGEYHDQVLETLEKWSGKGERDAEFASEIDGVAGTKHDWQGKSVDMINQEISQLSYRIIARCLTKCGCFKSAYDFCARGLAACQDDSYLNRQRALIAEQYIISRHEHESTWDANSFNPNRDLPDEGTVRREIYAWNTHEPDRFSPCSLSFLNAELAKVAPKCAAVAVTLPLLTNGTHAGVPAAVKQLGLFAKEDIAPGEAFLCESSILTVYNRLHDPLCDACSADLPPLSSSHTLYACPHCHDTIFCSAECLEKAMTTYHPAICDKDLDFLAKNTSPSGTTNSLYLLLLIRALAMAETQSLHPLDLNETKFLWGDFLRPEDTYSHLSKPSNSSASSPSHTTFATNRHLPFSFTHTVLHPLHILTLMDLDIFATVNKYDTWVFNTLFAKFRGNASARMSKSDGRPEVCAVHPMWCLANHSCAPNVRWEWGGVIKFWARDDTEVVRWGPEKDSDGDGRWQGGIRQGEQILNHYCDVQLGVQDRREWSVGALGGMCVCSRCVWEETREGERNGGQNR